MIEIRRLGDADAALLPQVNRLYGEAFGELDEYLGDPPTEAGSNELLSNDDAVLLVALDKARAIGALTAYVLPKFEQNRSELFIYDLAVAEEFRRRGIATRLIREAGNVARGRGVWMMFIQADAGDKAPLSLYRKLSVAEEVAHHFNIEP
ncbi:GNAT family N-acetyltransferase [Erythrobacter ani]|uniref:GNAT family N-acetyltransferase n=1 Tax=Erythrobacter ani TaxID=2827235 RepID=A0ABS6SLG4_9SPHN|nr:GNAT family N-acetyltransferase [Erythrobacter ani]MBV7265880.1 GNAT family N-acetyltransferase [Erythrobacter ani]